MTPTLLLPLQSAALPERRRRCPACFRPARQRARPCRASSSEEDTPAGNAALQDELVRLLRAQTAKEAARARRPWYRKAEESLPPVVRNNAPALRVSPASDLGVTGALFGAALLVALAQGTAPHAEYSVDSPPTLSLAVGFAAALYHLRTKGAPLPRAALLVVLGLAAGTILGSSAEAVLLVEVVPLGSLSSPAALISLFSLAGMFSSAALLI